MCKQFAQFVLHTNTYSHSRRILPVCARCKTKTNPPHADISAEIKNGRRKKQPPQCILCFIPYSFCPHAEQKALSGDTSAPQAGHFVQRLAPQ